MSRLYRYVGPDHIRLEAVGTEPGARIDTLADLVRWLERVTQRRPLVTATFTVSPEGVLHLADRRSEHIACSNGQPVLAAGELTFEVAGNGLIRVESASNQSTGFCPEPSSWSHVAIALERLHVSHPGRFTMEFNFRKCPTCGQTNIIKDDYFFCDVCGNELPVEWNYDGSPPNLNAKSI